MPQVVMQAPSYVPLGPQAMMGVNAPQALLAAGTAAMPQKLTEGIPNVEQIAQQKGMYAAALEKQLKDATEAVTKEVNTEKQLATFSCQKEIALFEMQVEERLTEQLAEVD